MNFNVINGILEIEGKVIHSFVVDKAIEKNGILIVLHQLQGANTSPAYDNVFGFNSAGHIIWRLKNPDPSFLGCVTSIFENEGKIAVWFFLDCGNYINEQTGEILENAQLPNNQP